MHLKDETMNDSISDTYKQLKHNYVYRTNAIVELCKNLNVLHLGCLCHSNWEEQLNKGVWLHSYISNVANKIVGIDYLQEDINKLINKYSFEAYYADVMHLDKIDINNVFDVIVCGELIEHLENPGLFLRGLKKFCHEDSKIILTTPNPWWIKRMNIFFAKKEPKKLNNEHVAYYSYWTLKNLLDRCGYSEIMYGYYALEKPPSQNNLIRRTISRLFIKSIPRELQRGLFFVAYPLAIL
jgi:SAM-dependent methyltransferase